MSQLLTILSAKYTIKIQHISLLIQRNIILTETIKTVINFPWKKMKTVRDHFETNSNTKDERTISKIPSV